MILSLADLKAHLRVDDDNEDVILGVYAEAAEVMLANWIGRPFYAQASDLPVLGSPGYDQYQMVADPAILAAVLMLVDRMYNFRDGDGAEGANAVPPLVVQALVSGHRVFRPSACETLPR
jgi:hypothetical protein